MNVKNGNKLMATPGRLKLVHKEGEPLEKAIYDALKHAIKYGYLMPGERLVEATLAEELQVSRTPLREAIRRLSFEKVVEIIQNKGATVRKLQPKEMNDIYYITAILAGAAAGRAVKYMKDKDIEKLKIYQSQMEDAISQNDYERWLRLNDRFHGVFVRKCDVTGLVELIREKVDMIPQNWYLLTVRPNPLKVYMEAHEKIIEAFIKKDANLVRDLVENHITTNGEILKEYLEKMTR
ncbi:MAG: GntR family transcriptional regulator [Thermodesulfobacteriota bacterium]|nr:GntR family transcriptional regulator [Thermodesulfobacteriota bacterium]